MSINSVFSNSSDLYSLNIKQLLDQTSITMKLGENSAVNTKNLPLTTLILLQSLPQIKKHKCYNPKNLKFLKEAQQTEIGHLFEHILLEYLYQLKKQNQKKVLLKGKTYWNWSEDEVGTFYININSKHEDIELFKKALGKTIKLTNKILFS